MRRIRIYDDRFMSITHVATHSNIPADWTVDMVLKCFGIPNNLLVYEDINGYSRKIQPYTEWPSKVQEKLNDGTEGAS